MDDATSRRHALVDDLQQRRMIHDAAVQAAFRAVPRHLFLPDVPLELVYSDQSIVTKTQGGLTLSSSSQPTIMAIMLEQLALQPGENVLEIGAGTGYNAALISQLVGARGRVTTIDVDADIVASARENLARAGFETVQVILADGGFGFPQHAPYDAMIATVGVWDLCPYWYEQLREGGRLVAPLQLGVRQFSIAFERRDNQLTSRSSVACGFLALRGVFTAPNAFTVIDSIVVQHENIPAFNAEALNALLNTTARSETIDELKVSGSTGLLDYISLRGGRLVSLFDRERKRLASGLMYALFDDAGLALLTMDAEWNELDATVQVFGNETALTQLRQFIADWATSGRPNLAAANITAVPLNSVQDVSNAFVVRKTWMVYYIQFENRE